MHYPEVQKFNATYGYEYEMADVLLLDAAKAVYEKQGVDFDLWRDRGMAMDTKLRDYDIYTVASDVTWNTNGSKSLESVYDPELDEVVPMKKANRHLCQTAELTSPVLEYNKIDEEWSDFEEWFSLMQSLGGVVSPWHWNDFNVHIGIDGWDLDDLKQHVEWQREVWEPLTDFRHYVDITDHFSPKKYPWNDTVYTRFMAAKDVEEAWYVYRQNQPRRTTDEPVHWSAFWKKLHPADPSSFLNPELPHNTLEWRVWPLVDDTDILKELVEFSVKNTHDPMPYDEVVEWVEYWGNKSAYMRDKKPDNLNRTRQTKPYKGRLPELKKVD